MTFNPACTFCKNTGWVVARHHTLIGVYGFRCGCSAGNRYSMKIPVWGSKYAETFTPDAEGMAPVMVRRHEPEPKKEPVKFKTDFKARAFQAQDLDDEDVPF